MSGTDPITQWAAVSFTWLVGLTYMVLVMWRKRR